MMKFRVHCEVAGQLESWELEGETLAECREKAHAEVAKRGGVNPWSEDLNNPPIEDNAE